MASMCARFPDENISWDSNMNISPALNWTGAPSGTMSFAVVLQDLSNGFAHWVIWNIPATTTGLPANVDKTDATPPVPAGSQQCNNGSGDGYFGPGSECNVYEFIVYALSTANFAPTSATMATNVRMQLQNLGNQILGQASLRGRSNYEMTCNP
jgi:Raf kinase inhibitor-like YbhB/YbcL family protein